MRKVRVELVVGVDLDSPMEVVSMVEEIEAQVEPDQWAALVLLSSAVVESVEEGLVHRLARAPLVRP